MKLKTGQFAKMLEVSSSYVRKLTSDGHFHPVVLPSGYRLFTEKDVQSAIEMNILSPQRAEYFASQLG